MPIAHQRLLGFISNCITLRLLLYRRICASCTPPQGTADLNKVIWHLTVNLIRYLLIVHFVLAPNHPRPILVLVLVRILHLSLAAVVKSLR